MGYWTLWVGGWVDEVLTSLMASHFFFLTTRTGLGLSMRRASDRRPWPNTSLFLPEVAKDSSRSSALPWRERGSPVECGLRWPLWLQAGLWV